MELTQIKGIGKKRIESLNSKDIKTVWDLAGYLPYEYQNMSQEQLPSEFENGKIVFVRAKVISNPVGLYFRSVHTTKVTILCEGTKLVCMWFNQPYMKANLTLDEEYFFYGKLKDNKGKFTILSPSFERVDNNVRLKGLVPKYKKIEGIGSGTIASLIKQAVEAESFMSIIPKNVVEHHSLMKLGTAYRQAHFPESMQSAKEGVSRIELEKLVRLMLSYKLFKEEDKGKSKYINCDVISSLESVLPFSLYSSQKTAITEICEDMRREKPMSRLLQGDVGSGKSVVMFGASVMVAKSKLQTAIMCPTTTLAMQHYANLKPLADKLGIKMALLCGASANSVEIKTQIRSGEIDIAIGTHALISDSVKFHKLGLVVIDEQQKFGVNQRAKLVEKGENADLLTVTATPIPRSLALILYGEVNVSYVSKENGISNVKTHIIGSEKIKNCYDFLADGLKKGGFLFVVCPKIYDEENSENFGVIEKYKEIKKIFKNFKVGLLHGDLTDEERQKVTEELFDGKLDVLVSTSIIEVGIDCEKANMMLIFQAENFGLSSLHQLRGRVGRKGQESYCFLCNDGVNEKQKERLAFFKNNNDGFKIADFDLETRGAGEFMGTMQHGKSANELFFKMSFEQVKFAKTLADEIINTLDGNQLTLMAKSLFEKA